MIINYSDEDVIKGEKSIFLAGPIPRNKEAISWRIEACNILENMGFDGRPDNAEKIKYLDWLYELDYGNKPINNLSELLEIAVIKTNEEKLNRIL